MISQFTYRSAFISALFATFPFVAFFGSKGIVVLLVLMSLGLLGFSVLEKNKEIRLFSNPTLCLVIAFFGLSVASALWGFDLKQGIFKSLRAFSVSLFGVGLLWSSQFLKDDEVRVSLKVFLGSTLLLFVLFCVEGALNGYMMRDIFHKPKGLFVLYKGFAIMPLLIWPFLVCVVNRTQKTNWFLMGALLLALTPIFYVSPVRASVLAFASSIFVFGVVYLFPRLSIALKYILIVLALVFPFMILYFGDPSGWGDQICKLPGSWQHRTYIWHHASKYIAQSPWVGWGSNASQYLNDQFNLFVCLKATPTGRELSAPWYTTLLYHPHNGYLQTWLEMGVLGVCVYIALLMSFFKNVEKKVTDRFLFAAINASVAAFSVIFLASFDMWENWWLASLFWVAFVWSLLLRWRKANHVL